MKLNNTPSSYSPEEINSMSNRIREFMVTLKETDMVLTSMVSNAGKNQSEESETPLDNLIWLDRHPFTEFEHLKDKEMPFHEILEKYEEWVVVLCEEVVKNARSTRNKRVVQHLIELRKLIGTLGAFLEPVPGPKVG